MEIEYLISILYLQYNTIAEEAHSHPVCEGFLLICLPIFVNNNNKYSYSKFVNSKFVFSILVVYLK